MAVVTIGRTGGSGGEEIGKAVAEKLGYEYVGKNLILKGVEVHGEQWLEWGRQLDEHGPSPWERFDRSFTGFVSLVECCIYGYALEDNKVITGRGGNWLLKDIPFVLRTYITAPIEERIRRVSDREHVNMETARRMIEFSDHERSSYLHTVYHRDGSNPEDYDMVFNTGSLSHDEVVGQILEEISARDKLATAEALEKLRQLALAAEVKAQISTDFRTFVPTLEVFHDGKQVVVRGIVHSAKEQKLVMETAKSAAGSTSVRSELHFRGA
jgi:cytidylate kinase